MWKTINIITALPDGIRRMINEPRVPAKNTERVLLTCVGCASQACPDSEEGRSWLRRTSESRLAACAVCLPWLTSGSSDRKILDSMVPAGRPAFYNGSLQAPAPDDPASREQVMAGEQAWTRLHEVILPGCDPEPGKPGQDTSGHLAWARGWYGLRNENLYLRARAQGDRAARRAWFQQCEAVNPWRGKADDMGRIAMWGWADGYIRPAPWELLEVAKGSRRRKVYGDHLALGMEGAARARRGQPVELPLSARCFSHIRQRWLAFHGWWDGFVEACIDGDRRGPDGAPARDIDVTTLLPAEARRGYSNFPGVPFNVVRRVIRPNGSWLYVPLDDSSFAAF